MEAVEGGPSGPPPGPAALRASSLHGLDPPSMVAACTSRTPDKGVGHPFGELSPESEAACQAYAQCRTSCAAASNAVGMQDEMRTSYGVVRRCTVAVEDSRAFRPMYWVGDGRGYTLVPCTFGLVVFAEHGLPGNVRVYVRRQGRRVRGDETEVMGVALDADRYCYELYAPSATGALEVFVGFPGAPSEKWYVCCSSAREAVGGELLLELGRKCHHHLMLPEVPLEEQPSILQIDEGELRLKRHGGWFQDTARAIIFICKMMGLGPGLTEEQLQSACSLHKNKRYTFERRYETALEWVGLKHHGHGDPRSLDPSSLPYVLIADAAASKGYRRPGFRQVLQQLPLRHIHRVPTAHNLKDVLLFVKEDGHLGRVGAFWQAGGVIDLLQKCQLCMIPQWAEQLSDPRTAIAARKMILRAVAAKTAAQKESEQRRVQQISTTRRDSAGEDQEIGMPNEADMGVHGAPPELAPSAELVLISALIVELVNKALEQSQDAAAAAADGPGRPLSRMVDEAPAPHNVETPTSPVDGQHTLYSEAGLEQDDKEGLQSPAHVFGEANDEEAAIPRIVDGARELREEKHTAAWVMVAAAGMEPPVSLLPAEVPSTSDIFIAAAAAPRTPEPVHLAQSPALLQLALNADDKGTGGGAAAPGSDIVITSNETKDIESPWVAAAAAEPHASAQHDEALERLDVVIASGAVEVEAVQLAPRTESPGLLEIQVDTKSANEAGVASLGNIAAEPGDQEEVLDVALLCDPQLESDVTRDADRTFEAVRSSRPDFHADGSVSLSETAETESTTRQPTDADVQGTSTPEVHEAGETHRRDRADEEDGEPLAAACTRRAAAEQLAVLMAAQEQPTRGADSNTSTQALVKATGGPQLPSEEGLPEEDKEALGKARKLVEMLSKGDEMSLVKQKVTVLLDKSKKAHLWSYIFPNALPVTESRVRNPVQEPDAIIRVPRGRARNEAGCAQARARQVANGHTHRMRLAKYAPRRAAEDTIQQVPPQTVPSTTSSKGFIDIERLNMLMFLLARMKKLLISNKAGDAHTRPTKMSGGLKATDVDPLVLCIEELSILERLSSDEKSILKDLSLLFPKKAKNQEEVRRLTEACASEMAWKSFYEGLTSPAEKLVAKLYKSPTAKLCCNAISIMEDVQSKRMWFNTAVVDLRPIFTHFTDAPAVHALRDFLTNTLDGVNKSSGLGLVQLEVIPLLGMKKNDKGVELFEMMLEDLCADEEASLRHQLLEDLDIGKKKAWRVETVLQPMVTQIKVGLEQIAAYVDGSSGALHPRALELMKRFLDEESPYVAALDADLNEVCHLREECYKSYDQLIKEDDSASPFDELIEWLQDFRKGLSAYATARGRSLRHGKEAGRVRPKGKGTKKKPDHATEAGLPSGA